MFLLRNVDIEMRLGFLGRIGDMNVNGHMSFPELLPRPTHSMQQGSSVTSCNSQAGTYSWLSQGDLHMPNIAVSHLGVGGGMEPKKKESDDVDVMSSDSSSSSSSDSQ